MTGTFETFIHDPEKRTGKEKIKKKEEGYSD